jgi:hypothetical protein
MGDPGTSAWTFQNIAPNNIKYLYSTVLLRHLYLFRYWRNSLACSWTSAIGPILSQLYPLMFWCSITFCISYSLHISVRLTISSHFHVLPILQDLNFFISLFSLSIVLRAQFCYHKQGLKWTQL